MAGFRITVTPDADGRIGEALSDYFINQLGPRILENARRTVPVSSYHAPPGAPGDLKRSIIVQVDTGDNPVLQVGVDEEIANVDYGRYVEEGTSIQIAQPYLRPAVYQARGQG